MVLHSVPEVARRLGVATPTAWRWCNTGCIKATRVGRNWIVSEEDLCEFEQRMATREALRLPNDPQRLRNPLNGALEAQK
jgi:excisionase family DNA binding protein